MADFPWLVELCPQVCWFQLVSLPSCFAVGVSDPITVVVVQQEHGRSPEELPCAIELVQDRPGIQGSVVFSGLDESDQPGLPWPGPSSGCFLGGLGVMPSSSPINSRASSYISS